MKKNKLLNKFKVTFDLDCFFIINMALHENFVDKIKLGLFLFKEFWQSYLS
jgi:hypothetical protein